QAARGLGGDEVEVRRLSTDDATERDDAGVAARLRERHHRQRKLESSRHRDDGNVGTRDPVEQQLIERLPQEPGRDLAVEPADDDGNSAALTLGLAFDDLVAVWDLEAAGDMLERRHRDRLLLGV